MNPELIAEDHEHDFEVQETDPYHERCMCGAVREVPIWADGEFA